MNHCKVSANALIWMLVWVFASLTMLDPAAATQLRPLHSGLHSEIVAVQAASGLNDPQRNCQTLRNCNFSKGGSFRGCVSSYSCRRCYFVTSKCSVGATTGKCQRQLCDWGS